MIKLGSKVFHQYYGIGEAIAYDPEDKLFCIRFEDNEILWVNETMNEE